MHEAVRIFSDARRANLWLKTPSLENAPVPNENVAVKSQTNLGTNEIITRNLSQYPQAWEFVFWRFPELDSALAVGSAISQGNTVYEVKTLVTDNRTATATVVRNS